MRNILQQDKDLLNQIIWIWEMNKMEKQENEEEIERDPKIFWEKKQREIITNVIDYNLESINNLIESEIIELSTEYERRNRWTVEQQSLLIESFLMNIPIHRVVLNETKDGKLTIVDGKQRLYTVYRFLQNEFKITNLEIFSGLNGCKFKNLPPEYQDILKTQCVIRAVIILTQSDPDIKYEVFQRINQYQTSKNAQEIRNGVYPGPFNDLILDLSQKREFHKLLGIKNKEDSKIFKDMKDVELVLRFLCFKDNQANFHGNISRKMDIFMEKNKDIPENTEREFESAFKRTFGKVDSIFGNSAFRKWDTHNNKIDQKISVSLYDAQMFSCYKILENANLSVNQRDKLLNDYKLLFSDVDFLNSITKSTNNLISFQTRVKKMSDLIKRFL